MPVNVNYFGISVAYVYQNVSLIKQNQPSVISGFNSAWHSKVTVKIEEGNNVASEKNPLISQ